MGGEDGSINHRLGETSKHTAPAVKKQRKGTQVRS